VNVDILGQISPRMARKLYEQSKGARVTEARDWVKLVAAGLFCILASGKPIQSCKRKLQCIINHIVYNDHVPLACNMFTKGLVRGHFDV